MRDILWCVAEAAKAIGRIIAEIALYYYKIVFWLIRLLLIACIASVLWFVPSAAGFQALFGSGILVLGVYFIVKTRRILTNSSVLDRALQTDGPFAVTRHPMYSGVSLTAWGTAVITGKGYVAFLAALIMILMFSVSCGEDQENAIIFGEKYQAYSRKVYLFGILFGLMRRCRVKNFKNTLPWYVIKRVVQGIPLIIIVVLFTFTVIQMAPGSPIALMGGSDGITAEQEAMLKKQWGLDEPLWKQCTSYCKNMLTFELGTSYRQNQPVTEIILDRLPATLILMVPALIAAVILGVGVGMYCSKHMHSLGDSMATVFALAGYSVPLFWIGQLLILIFGMKLGWLPISGMYDLRMNHQGKELVIDVIRHLILPGTCLTFYYSAVILRVTRTKMAEVLQADYIKTARAKGLREKRVICGHALRNAISPVITVVGMELGAMIMGATVVETVFSYPGTGRLIYDAVAQRDYPLIAGMFFFISMMVILANVLTDILYAVVDPQVRYE